MKNTGLTQIFLKLKALEPKYFFAVFVLAALVLVGLDLFLIARPQINAVTALDERTKQLKADIKLLADNTQRLPKFRSNLDESRRQLKDFKAMVHQEDAIPSVLKTISTIANQYGVKIDQLVPQKSDGVVLVHNEDGKYGSLSVLVRVRSGYHDLGRFLNRLEQEHVFWQLEEIDITADDREMGRHAVKMQMKILVIGG